MRVLLTGATGFVGRHVLATLVAAGHDVVATSRHPVSVVAKDGIKWIHADLLDECDCKRVVSEAQAGVLIHTAWYAEHGKFWDAPENLDWSRTTAGLLQAFIQNCGKRAVFAGTCAEYDWQHGYCTEGVTPTEPSTLYGQCKDATRRLTQALADRVGIEWAWGRIFFSFGYGEPSNRLLPSVINALLMNEPVLCSHGRQYRDFLPVEDVAAAFVHLACNTHACGAFNVSSGVPIRLSELVEFCVQYLNSSIKPQFGEIKVPENDPPLLVGNNQKLKASGWKNNYAWREALATMMDKYMQQHRGKKS